MRLTPTQLITELASIVDPDIARIVIKSYVDMQNRFLVGDWKPSELNGGELCEAISRGLFQLDTARITHRKSVREIREYLLDLKGPNPHKLKSKDRHHISKAIEVVYKFRSDRGVAHISKDYNANQMDSMFVIHVGKWILAEFLRLAWNKDENIIAEAISRLIQIEHALIHEFDGKPLVLSTDISCQEEILLLLNHAPTNVLNKELIREQAPFRSSQLIDGALRIMAELRQIRIVSKNEYALTPKGQKRVLEEIMPKLKA